MAHNTRYDEGDDVIVDSKPLERHGDKGWVERISKPDSDSPTYHIRFPDQPDGTAPISFKAGDLKKGDWKAQAKRELEEHLDVDTEMKGAYHLQVKGSGEGFSLIAKDGQEGSNGEREWMVFKDYQEAKEAAIDEVYRNLEERPQTFNESFIEDYIYVPRDKAQEIAEEEARVLYEAHDEEEIVEEAHAHGFDTDDPQVARRKLENKEADDIQPQIEDYPVRYFVGDRGMYTRENLLQQDFIEIDKEEAAEQAVRADGEAHYLDHYDGRGIELPSGAVAYGAN